VRSRDDGYRRREGMRMWLLNWARLGKIDQVCISGS